MSKGIYLFWDNKYEQVIYAGKFTRKQRIKEHFYKSKKNTQPINAYIQEHPDRIESVIFCEFDDISDNDLNQLEMETIRLFKLNKYRQPDNFVFNFTDGGDGTSGYTPSKETRKKISDSRKGKNHPNYGKKRPEHSIRMSGKNNPNYGNKKKYPRIIKGGVEHGKQIYKVIYNGKHLFQSVNKEKLYERWYDKHPDIELIDETK